MHKSLYDGKADSLCDLIAERDDIGHHAASFFVHRTGNPSAILSP